jgi:hypothetical protein
LKNIAGDDHIRVSDYRCSILVKVLLTIEADGEFCILTAAVLPVPVLNTLLAMVTEALFETSIPIAAFVKVKFFIVTFVTLFAVMTAPVLLPVMNVLAASRPRRGTLLMSVMGTPYVPGSTKTRKLVVVGVGPLKRFSAKSMAAWMLEKWLGSVGFGSTIRSSAMAAFGADNARSRYTAVQTQQLFFLFMCPPKGNFLNLNIKKAEKSNQPLAYVPSKRFNTKIPGPQIF